MGWVVYDQDGEMVKYYQREASAKSAVTKYHNQVKEGVWYYGLPRCYAYCTYRDYEGVLMGLRDDALKMWQFCHSKNG